MESTSLSRSHRQLVSQLRQLREDKGLSGIALGELLGWSQSKVSKIENGRTKPSADDAEAWATACDATPDLASQLGTLADAVANEVRPWSARHGSLADRNREIAATEAETNLLRNFQPAVIPGLLQTADYARRVLTMLDVAGTRDISAAVAVRMERQATLYDQSKSFEFLLTEGALRWRPGPRSLMLAQLDRLVSIATLPNVRLGILPFEQEAATLYTNGFTIFETTDGQQVLAETLTYERRMDEENFAAEMAIYRDAYDRLQGVAVTGGDAVEIIRAVMADLAAAD